MPRWNIVRTIRTQTVAEHQHMVTVYANDIALYLDLPWKLRLAVAMSAPWHDTREEIFSGDLPGPNKRALLSDESRYLWDKTIDRWAEGVFPNLNTRMGMDDLDGNERLIVKTVIKIADWLDAANEMATEAQMGNRCTARHIEPNMNGALQAADKLCSMIGLPLDREEVPLPGDPVNPRVVLKDAIRESVRSCQYDQSAGPWIAKEDAEREGRYEVCTAGGDGR